MAPDSCRCSTRRSAPLRFAGHAVVVTVHLGVRAVADEERGFFAGAHLRTVLAPVAAEGLDRRGRCACRCRYRGRRGRCRCSFRRQKMPIAGPGSGGDQQPKNQAAHAGDFGSKPVEALADSHANVSSCPMPASPSRPTTSATGHGSLIKSSKNPRRPRPMRIPLPLGRTIARKRRGGEACRRAGRAMQATTLAAVARLQAASRWIFDGRSPSARWASSSS